MRVKFTTPRGNDVWRRARIRAAVAAWTSRPPASNAIWRELTPEDERPDLDALLQASLSVMEALITCRV